MASKEINSISPEISNLKAYYRFESGALTTDSSGEGHTLTAISDPADDASGQFGGAVALDGNDAYSATDHADFRPTGNFTVGGWIKANATNANCIFQSWSANTNYAGIILKTTTTTGIPYFTSGRNNGTTANTHYKVITGSTNVCDGTWHFVVATWDGSYLNIYVDGASDASAVSWANAPAYAATNYVRVGVQCNAGSSSLTTFVTGSLDDVFLLNGTALTAEEVKGIYLGWKKYNGLSNVSVKTINGLAIGSIKSFNGI